MKRSKLPFFLVASPMLLIANLLSCGATREVQAPVAASAAPSTTSQSASDLRPPETLVEGDQRVEPSLPEAQDRDPMGQLVQAIEASGSLAPSALTKAAGLYVEAQSLEDTHAFPQAVAAYDRLLALNPDYADAGARRATLLELVRLADAFYLSAMDADSEEERLLYLRQVQQFWPEYRDVEQQLASLRQAAATDLLEQAKAEQASKPKATKGSQ